MTENVKKYRIGIKGTDLMYTQIAHTKWEAIDKLYYRMQNIINEFGTYREFVKDRSNYYVLAPCFQSN